jgi:hypothetical protein
MIVDNNSIIPMIQESIEIPRDSIITSFNVSFSEAKQYLLDKTSISNIQLIPSTTNKQLNKNATNFQILEMNNFNNHDKKLNKLYDFKVGCGISQFEPVLLISINFYPLSYDIEKKLVVFPKLIKYNLTYETNSKSITSYSIIDMVIICPMEFENLLDPLVQHKNQMGIQTIIKTTEDIYQEFSGRDESEKIKYFIKDSLEQWKINYVLLVGGLKGQSNEWYVPVRYSNLHDRAFWNDSYVTDLYFADIYRYNESTQSYEFEDWDKNNNDIFGEWTWIYDPDRGWWYDLDKKDDLDLYPDVAIGRLPCRSSQEVHNVVEKIITYEQNSYGQDWFKTVIYGGGDTVPFSDGICEGELENAYAASYLEPLGFESKNLWVSTGALNGPFDIIRELSKGAGFLYLSGHGTPREWCTHPVANDYRWIDLYAFEMKNIGNVGKLPICVVGGCHNSQFDVSLFRFKQGLTEYGLSYFIWNEGIECFFKWTWVPQCWSWNLVSQAQEGCIAVIGNTGLGWGVGGTYTTEYNEGYLTTRFFELYASLSNDDIHQLGQIHSATLNKYIQHFSANKNLLDRKTVEQWVLIGDPSLYIGGYPTAN